MVGVVLALGDHISSGGGEVARSVSPDVGV